MKKQSIVTDREYLSLPCQKVGLQDGLELAKKLSAILMESPEGVGLAANQIGIRKAVCIINVVEPIILINPVILLKRGDILFEEACLSFPDVQIRTKRYAEIEVRADNYEKNLKFDRERSLLECVCVQHEIDHLNGITMYDREDK